MARASVEKRDGSRRWMLMESSGQEMILDVDKYAIMERTHIHPRDFRVLDPCLSYPSTILRRDSAIILNLEHIKAIITANEVYIRDPLDDDVFPVAEKLRMRLKPSSASSRHQDDKRLSPRPDVEESDAEHVREYASPFEFKVLEVTLEDICSHFVGCTKEFEATLYPALDMLTSKISNRGLDEIRKLKSQMTRLCSRLQKVKDELQQLLDDDHKMSDLCLSKKSINKPTATSVSNCDSFHLAPASVDSWIYGASKEDTLVFNVDEDDIAELESILEDCFKQIDGLLNRLNTLQEYINSTEDYLNIQLDSRQLQFLQMELFISAAVVGIGIHSVSNGVFATSVPYTWNYNHAYTFTWVAIVPAIVGAILFALVILSARKKGLLGP